MKIEVFGSGCSKCTELYDIVKDVISKAGKEAEIIKVNDMKEIVSRGIMRTPALAVNGKVLCAGRIPKPEEVEGWTK